MITEGIKEFAERVGHAFVATSDTKGNPHLAAGRGVSALQPNRLVFEAWFCRTTLRNLQDNPKIAVAIVDPATGNGYQFFGCVEKKEDTALLDGFLPGVEPPELPQVQWRLDILVESVTAFSADAHSDRPLG
jgi:predicted pyridoxine 5'-phosphate oxidase superfamily flavin-nucleotide-binding protein